MIVRDQEAKGARSMEHIKWDDDISVGIQKMDDQHKHLHALVNDLLEAMDEENSVALNQAFEDLIQYTRMHFAAEENLLITHGYRQTHIHKKIHHDLIAQLLEIQEDVRGGKSAGDPKSRQFLEDWLNNHIITMDKPYGLFLNAKGIH
ncbi:MAG: bacteriohemerythrin [Candidatus Sumerlaeota bacterium]|nr:bacteriohemerythrin [Candidatus Sumerlaeota bacterium]